MISVLLATAVLQPKGFPAAITRCQHWLASNRDIAVTIQANSQTSSRPENKFVITLELRKNVFKLHWLSNGDNFIGPIDWFYSDDGTFLEGFDLLRHERLKAKGGTLQLIRSLPQAARMILVRGDFDRLLAPLARVSPWKSVSPGAWKFSANGRTTVLSFVPSTGALKRYQSSKGTQKTDWIFTYGPVKSQLPPDTGSWNLVTAFIEPSPLPDYHDSAAKEVAARAVRAYDSQEDMHIHVHTESSDDQIWRTKAGLAESCPKGSWTYVKGLLTTMISGKRSEVKVKSRELIDKLYESGLEVDPLMETWIEHRNYAAKIFTRVFRAAAVGQLGAGAKLIDLVELDEGQVKSIVSVNRQGWIVGLKSTVLKANGSIFSRSERTYEFDPKEPLPKL